MSRSGRLRWYATAFTCYGIAYLLSQVRFKEEREFPEKFGEIASGEHGHETAADAADEFFGIREQARRLMWLFLALGFLLHLRESLRSS